MLPDKISTLHGIQCKTADPGLAAHWKFPKNLSPEALWLTHYVILSRPRSLANLLSFGLPSRKILEAGPPKAITEAFQRAFGDKLEKTKEACAEARRELGGLQGSPREVTVADWRRLLNLPCGNAMRRNQRPPWYDEKCASVRAADWRRSSTFRRLADV